MQGRCNLFNKMPLLQKCFIFDNMKKAIVFGATSGMGKALAELLVKDGYKIAITGRRLEKLKEFQALYPQQVIYKQNDIQQVEDVEKVFNEIVAEFKTIDLVIQSTGVGSDNYHLDWKIAEETILTNVLGVTKLYDLAYKLFEKQTYGHLMGITSVASLRGLNPGQVYAASKAYQKAYLEGLYIRSGKGKRKNIIISEVRPGFVDTKMAVGKVFWLIPLEKAAKQIYAAIKKKKRVTYISKRWSLVAFVANIAPAWLMKKVM